MQYELGSFFMMQDIPRQKQVPESKKEDHGESPSLEGIM